MTTAAHFLPLPLRAGLSASVGLRGRHGNKGGRPKKGEAPRGKESFEPLKLLPQKLRFHDLRHTVASVLLSQGQSVRAVSQRLGHSNPALTLRVYAHCMPSDDAQLASGLNRLLG
jgi:integrase